MVGCENRSLKSSKIPSVAPIFDSDPASVHIELTCSLCDETDILGREAGSTDRRSIIAAAA
jgi:hypothetical protein